jgi:hypothetical protein
MEQQLTEIRLKIDPAPITPKHPHATRQHPHITPKWGSFGSNQVRFTPN